jgi:hypothetical protein
MKFVTRARAKVDRIACPWLIRRFVDPNAEFTFLPAEEVLPFAERENAIPFDVEGVELGHDGPYCSFDAIIKKYELQEPALLELANIVRGADTAHRDLTPESAGLFAIASGFHALCPHVFADDHALMDVEFPMYDALFEHCRSRLTA